jgi:DNA-binding PadR family transcriptional regulator
MFHRGFFQWERKFRLFEKGDLKYVILDLLKDKPSHGYEIIRALEERFHGFYSPSAGSIYPTLQLLEDMGHVKSSEADGKKVYTITDEGRKFLTDRVDTMDKIKLHMRAFWNGGNREEFRDAMREVQGMVHLMTKNFNRMDPDKLAKIKEIIKKASGEIEKVVETEKKA